VNRVEQARPNDAERLRLVCFSPSARRRTAEAKLENVDFGVVDAEAMDLPDASFDAVLCRYGYMLMADPAAALRETHRVLPPGAPLALSRLLNIGNRELSHPGVEAFLLRCVVVSARSCLEEALMQPRLLLVPHITELEWVIKPQLEGMGRSSQLPQPVAVLKARLERPQIASRAWP
jgi:SAM-dependent methyltransferase